MIAIARSAEAHDIFGFIILQPLTEPRTPALALDLIEIFVNFSVSAKPGVLLNLLTSAQHCLWRPPKIIQCNVLVSGGDGNGAGPTFLAAAKRQHIFFDDLALAELSLNELAPSPAHSLPCSETKLNHF